jgi:hypothetical protein
VLDTNIARISDAIARIDAIGNEVNCAGAMNAVQHAAHAVTPS